MTQPGRKYGGRYEISQPIASGGMAEVFLARDNLLGRNVALKVLHPEFARDNAFITRFKREAQAAASLNDPRVVSIFDWGSDDGTYYIVMEYVQGKTLRDLLDQEGRLLPQRAAEIAADVCSALHLAHQHGIVHRDIKPANVAVTPGGQTKVMDFGIARGPADSSQTITQTGTVIGTASYLSPEQAQGLPVDSRSDVYSTAVVLYEMLTGDVPFKAETSVGVAYKHVKEDPVHPSKLNEDIPGDLDSIVMKGLAKNPDNRYQDAEEMARDLKRWLEGDPVHATPLLVEDSAPTRVRDATVARRERESTRVMPAVEAPTGRKALIYVFTFLLFFGIIIAAFALIFSLFGKGGATIEVPNVVGLHEDEAQRKLDAKNLVKDVVGRDPHETIPAAHVISQEPSDGFKVKEGTRIHLRISTGPERVEVPSVAGKPQTEAEKLLKEAGLGVGAIRNQTSEDVESGSVISQDPPAGRSVERGTSVDLVISSGKKTAKVPDVRGFSEERAREILLDRNLVPVVKKVCRTSENDERVLSQDPAPGTEVAEGSDVTITVNDTVRVPNVFGDSESKAEADLKAAGFTVQKKNDKDGDTGQKVIAQDPAGGSSACSGDTVTITLQP